MPQYELENGSTITMLHSGTQEEIMPQSYELLQSQSTEAVTVCDSYGNTVGRMPSFSREFLSSWGRLSGGQSSEEQKKRYIKQYDYIPEPFQFHKIDNEEELYLGVELEIDNGGELDETAKYVCDYMNSSKENVYCKHDGSLHNGFEIVTHPCTIEYHKQLPYEKLFKELAKKNYRSHDTTTCGFHVHINRNYFGEKKFEQDLNISKLLYLYEKFWSKVEIVARRKSNRYAKRFFLEDDESPIDLYAKSKDEGKYGSINLKHKNTVEVRIFKGTLNASTYFNTLEFVNVMAHMAKETDIYDIQFVTWDKIISLFSDELNQYILDREETVKKEDNKPSNPEPSTFNAFSQNSVRGGYMTCNPYVCGNPYSDMQMQAYENLLRSAHVSSNNDYFVSSSEYNNQQHEISEEEQLERKIRDLRTSVRRSRNGLEITNLNRRIATLETELRRLRQRNRTTQ